MAAVTQELLPLSLYCQSGFAMQDEELKAVLSRSRGANAAHAAEEHEVMDTAEVIAELPLSRKRRAEEEVSSAGCNKRGKMECIGSQEAASAGELESQPLLSAKRRRGGSQAGCRTGTHIHDLPDECLGLILARLGSGDGSMRNMALRAAAVCKRWAGLMEIGVADVKLTGHFRAQIDEEAVTELDSEQGVKADDEVQVVDEHRQGQEQGQEQEQEQVDLGSVELSTWGHQKSEESDETGDNVEEFLFGKGLRLSKDAVRIDSLVHSLHRLQGLKNLRISFFLTVMNWDNLLSAVGANCHHLESFSLLDHLGTISKASLVNLAVGCRGLKELRLGNGKMDELPDELFELRNLKALTLSSWGGIRSLPPALSQLTNLEELEMVNCWKLEDLSPAMGSLSSLRHLTLTGCDSLRSLPASIGRIHSLEELSLAECFSLHELPDSIGQLPRLQCLGVFRCTNLERLPDSLGRLVSLYHLDLAGCSALRSLPETLSGLSNLERLRIVDCCRFADLPRGLGAMKSLQELEISFATISSIPESIGELGNLRVLSLQKCPGLTHLPDTLGSLSGLEEMNLSFCEALRDLPETMGGMTGLKTLDMYQCKSITTLPSSMMVLTSLEVCI